MCIALLSVDYYTMCVLEILSNIEYAVVVYC